MKRNIAICLLLLVVSILSASGCSKSQSSNDALTVETNISVSTDARNPAMNDSVQTITLTFNEALDPKTVAGAVKLNKLDASGNPTDEQFIIKVDPSNPARILINNQAITRFDPGEEYKISIGTALKAASGKALKQEYVQYFATNNTFLSTSQPPPGATRSKIVVISDMHMGVDDAFAECNKNRAPLIAFLNQVKNSPDVKEIVIAGDLVDEWFMPMNYVMPASEGALADAIAANNKPVFDAVNEIIKGGQIKVTYVNGNHDILLTQADIDRLLPGINQARDVPGLGTYVCGTNGEIAIEHGHRQNFFCAPDPISNRDITNNGTSILPPGYFFTRIATSSVVEGHPASGNTFPDYKPNEQDPSQFALYLYAKTWSAILSGLPVKESLNDKAIKTNIDGYTQDYSINDLVPQQDPQSGILSVVLYKGIQDTWEQRQKANNVQVLIPVNDAIAKANDNGFTDQQSKIQYFDMDASKRIVIFGHTHVVQLIPFTNLKQQKTLYANSGTWIDQSQGFPAMTCVVVTLPKAGSGLETVNVYKYNTDQSITQWFGGQAITTW